MKKLVFSLAALALVAACNTASRADFNAPPAPRSPQYAGPVSTVGQYGWNPVIKKLLWWKKDDCSSGGKFNRACATDGSAGQGPPGTPGNMTGTLVFPVNPFIRSPRDYFMHGQGGN